MLKCQFKSLTGFDCPGCGLQRSVLALIEGDLASSFVYYPGLFPLIIALTFTISFILTKKNALMSIANGMFITAGVVIAGNWLLKIIGLLPCPI